jgi:hypothetical protein
MSGFVEAFKVMTKENTITNDKDSTYIPSSSVLTLIESKSAEDILRSEGYKIKLITPTSFGTQIDLAKQYSEDEINDVLSDFEIRVKGKSVFVVD